MIIRDLIRKGAFKLKKVSGNPQLEALILFEKASGSKRETIFSNYNENTDEIIIKKFIDLLKRRVDDREPLPYILGFKEFYSLQFKVNKNVLIPRVETEELVDLSLNFLKNKSFPKILDIGTGSGNIIISIAKNLKRKAEYFASDISEKALEVAIYNANHHNVKINFLISDLFNGFKRKPFFDLIVSNPPYISEQEYKRLEIEVKKEPKKALITKDDGLFIIKQLIRESPSYLKSNGMLLLEIGDNQKEFFNQKKLIFSRDIFKKWRFLSLIKN